ncbi:helix-turn-helix domain-containing protein [Nocardia terpenica]|uniref:HTH cro/C1-type domain-containing protein n=1 Tax=Nocardia terpenica TaxID=455432 RepID=A0A164H0S3_9NOCA|nr:helix-turn-helix transcriptional regulator [Nocardia terpenica]KZM68105.1 hypothetical protein AWN90_09190 [Nocardia terpenica]NQE89038.1 helix-turn-helix transcriptional regulator [Nocardia terpenica]
MEDTVTDFDKARAAGQILKDARIQADLTRQQMADAARLSSSRVEQIEHGRAHHRGELRPTRPSRSVLIRWFAALGLDTDRADRVLSLFGHAPLVPDDEVVYLGDLAQDQQRQIRNIIAEFRSATQRK